MTQHFKLYMNACFEQKKPIYDARRILFVDQSISVLRIMLARRESADVLVEVDFVELIGQFCTYITALDDNMTSRKIKIKLCQFCDSLVSQRNQLSIHKDVVVRSILLKTIHRWTSDFDLQASGNTPLWHPRSRLVKSLTLEDNLQVDLDMACLKTMVPVLYQLPLQPTEPTREVDLIQRKSKMFYKYFTFFLKLLDRCKGAEVTTRGL
jgi:neurofibromin 1